MKKLTIADIKAIEILSKEERKMVIGGMEGSGEGTCGLNCYKDGVKTEIRNMTRGEAIAEQIAWQHNADARAYYDKCYYCCESC